MWWFCCVEPKRCLLAASHAILEVGNWKGPHRAGAIETSSGPVLGEFIHVATRPIALERLKLVIPLLIAALSIGCNETHRAGAIETLISDIGLVYPECCNETHRARLSDAPAHADPHP